DVRVDVARRLRLAHRALQGVGPVSLLLEHGVADGARPTAVVLLGDGPEEATARKDAALHVAEPRVAEHPHATQAAWLLQRRADDLVRKDLRRRLDRRQVQPLFRAEGGKQAALADPEVVGE